MPHRLYENWLGFYVYQKIREDQVRSVVRSAHGNSIVSTDAIKKNKIPLLLPISH